MLSPRAKLGLSATAALFLVAPAARAAYVEAHQTGDDVQIDVDGAGHARVEHTVRWNVLGGSLQKIDLRGIDQGAVLEPLASITTDDGNELPAHAEVDADRTLRVQVDDPKGLKRGLYTFRVRYSVDLVAAHAFVRDGAMWRFSWSSPVAPEGYDGARLQLSFPSAQTEPRGEEGLLATLRRVPNADELELVRPHIGRGETPRWAARVDPKAFPGVHSPELRPAAPPSAPLPNRAREVGYATALLAIAIAFASAVRAKLLAFSARGRAAGLEFEPRGLISLGPRTRALLAGASLAAGISVQMAGFPTIGAVLVVIAMLSPVSRVARPSFRPRGPGHWLALRPSDAFGVDEMSRPGDRLDVGTRAGKLTALALGIAITAIAVTAYFFSPELVWLILLDSVVLVPLFATGRGAQLPPDPARAPARVLQKLARLLADDKNLKVLPWARIPVGQELPDELRLLVVPKGSMPGVVGIEVGMAWSATSTGYVGTPEVLVRVSDSSAAALKMSKLAPLSRAIPGRKQSERVIRLLPRLPGIDGTKSLVVRLGQELADRRLAEPAPWGGSERRLPQNARAAA